MKKVLIADSDAGFSQQLTEHLQNTFTVLSCADGASALAILQREEPDVLIMDLILPEMDGISLLRQMEQLSKLPMIMIDSLFLNEFIMNHIGKYPVGYVARKPCSPSLLAERLQEMVSQNLKPMMELSDRDRVANFLLEIGFTTKMRGYPFIQESILLLAENPNMAITKELYPAIVKLSGSRTNTQQVERAMRIAIDKAWKNRDVVLWSECFPRQNWIRRPTNTTFLLCASDAVFHNEKRKMERAEGFLS